MKPCTTTSDGILKRSLKARLVNSPNKGKVLTKYFFPFRGLPIGAAAAVSD
jgi:hypothetical protein